MRWLYVCQSGSAVPLCVLCDSRTHDSAALARPYRVPGETTVCRAAWQADMLNRVVSRSQMLDCRQAGLWSRGGDQGLLTCLLSHERLHA